MSSAMTPQRGARRRGRLVRNFVFGTLSMVLATPLNVVGMLIMARRLGKETAGVCFTVFAITIVVYVATGAALSLVLTRRVAQADDEQRRRDIAEGTGMVLLASFAAIVAMAVTGAGWAVARGETVQWGLFLMAGVAVAGRHWMEFGIGALRGLERFEFETLTRVIQNGSFCLIVIAFVGEGAAGLWPGVAAFAISHLFAGVFVSLVLGAAFGYKEIRLSLTIAKDWIAEWIPLGWGDAMRSLGWHVDTIALSLLGNDAMVGLYNVAYRPLMPLRKVPQTLASVTFPMMSRQAKGDLHHLRQSFGKSVKALFFVSLPLSVLVTVYADPIVVLLAGEDFRESGPLLKAMIWISVVMFLTAQFRFLWTAMGQQRRFTSLTLLVLAVKVVLLVALIPSLGAWGACAASIVGEVVFAVAGLAICRQLQVGGLPYGLMLRAAAPGALMWAALRPTAAWPAGWALSAAALASLGYVALCLISGVFTLDERRQLQRAFRWKSHDSSESTAVG